MTKPSNTQINFATTACTNVLNVVEVLNAVEDGIYIINQDYIVEFMNQAMIGMFGPGVGKKCYNVINGNEVMCPWCRARDVFEAGKTVQSEIYIPRTDKTFRIIEVPIKNTDGTISKLNIYRDITTHRNQELKLRSTEQDYRRLFENVGVGVYISTKQGRFLDANHALLEMLGYKNKEEFLNLDIAQDIYVRSKDRRDFQEMIEKRGRAVNYLVDFKRKDNSIIPALITGHLRHDHTGKVIGYEGIFVDQSQIVKLEQRIKETHDFLQNIIHSSPNAIIGSDVNGAMFIWNQGAEETLGYKSNEVIGKMDVRQLYSKDMAYKVMKIMRAPDYGGVGKLRSYPMNFKHQNGMLIEGTLSANIIYDDQGNEMASVGFFVDLGERLAMERKLHSTQEQLLQSEKLAAMGRLTSQLAHELNNPLYGIMNTLELMKTEIPANNKRRKLLEMSLSETMRLADMLRKMLSFSKPDQEEKSPVDINTILDEILLLHEKQLRENDIRIDSSLTDPLPPVVASKNQLRQVFLNMVSNAKDSMSEGGTLGITTTITANTIKIRISDTGIGIKPENLDKIFDSFFTTKTDSVKGVGLGLSVCYGFIKDHGGDIKVESKPGAGTAFTILLPVSPE
ncbi:MAG: PAS domain S-box protein [Desulfobacteraceae bacterium]|nr:PAS domain S-box protein [Desulfobacteraceae bacterium]